MVDISRTRCEKIASGLVETVKTLLGEEPPTDTVYVESELILALCDRVEKLEKELADTRWLIPDQIYYELERY